MKSYSVTLWDGFMIVEHYTVRVKSMKEAGKEALRRSEESGRGLKIVKEVRDI